MVQPRLPPPPPLPSPAPAPLRTGAEAEAAEASETVENAEVSRPLPARFRRNRLGSPPTADSWMIFYRYRRDGAGYPSGN